VALVQCGPGTQRLKWLGHVGLNLPHPPLTPTLTHTQALLGMTAIMALTLVQVQRQMKTKGYSLLLSAMLAYTGIPKAIKAEDGSLLDMNATIKDSVQDGAHLWVTLQGRCCFTGYQGSSKPTIMLLLGGADT